MSKAWSAVVLLGMSAGGVQAEPRPDYVGQWRAVSSTARAITGDVVLAQERLSINFVAFPMAELRALKPEEATALFNPDTPADAGGRLFRLHVPATTRLLHKNTLCGSDDTSYMALYRSGRDLRVAFFSGASIPELTPEAISNSTSLCGTYTYTR